MSPISTGMVDPAARAVVLARAADAQAAREHRKAEVAEHRAVAHAAVDDEATKARAPLLPRDMISPQ